MKDGITEFAVAGDFGIDVFRRMDDQNQRRYRYECVATVSDGEAVVVAHSDYASHHPDRILSAAKRFAQGGFAQATFALGDATGYPRAGAARTTSEIFLYLDFFRLWQIADQEIARMTALAQSGAACSMPEISAVLRLVLDFNRVRDAQPLIAGFTPQLLAVASTGKDDKWQNAGYALRIVGDLQMRAGDPLAALKAYEASILLGDNRYRRGLAIKAAHAAELRDETLLHLDAYQRRWSLPDWLDAIRNSLVPQPSGELP